MAVCADLTLEYLFTMRHLNYSHLLYFWTVAREGSIAKASETLHITPQTISGQLKLLEDAVGDALFRRVGRGLALTETGQVVNLYADEIFSLGAELTQRVQNKLTGLPAELNVGMVSSIPKLIGFQTLAPALELDERIRIVCNEGDLDQLLGELAVHRLDMVISDRPIPVGLNVKAYNHKLGNSPIAFYAQKKIAAKYARNFPQSLHRAPMLLPAKSNEVRRNLEDWFEQQEIVPDIIAECGDSALLKAFGESGIGIFPAPSAISEQIQQMYHSRIIGTVDSVVESYYAISPERKLKHPGVLKITEEARERLFA